MILYIAHIDCLLVIHLVCHVVRSLAEKRHSTFALAFGNAALQLCDMRQVWVNTVLHFYSIKHFIFKHVWILYISCILFEYLINYIYLITGEHFGITRNICLIFVCLKLPEICPK